MDRKEPPGVCDVPHPDAVSGDAAVSANGSARAHPASRLDALRHGPCRLSAKAYDSRRTRAGICLDLPALVFACVDLATAPGGLAGHSPVFGNVVPLQALEPFLAPADQT